MKEVKDDELIQKFNNIVSLMERRGVVYSPLYPSKSLRDDLKDVIKLLSIGDDLILKKKWGLNDKFADESKEIFLDFMNSNSIKLKHIKQYKESCDRIIWEMLKYKDVLERYGGYVKLIAQHIARAYDLYNFAYCYKLK